MKDDVVKSELINAAKLLDNFSKNITIFGSARINQEHDLAKKAYQLGKLLSDSGLNILTGAGLGIMQAANQGAFDGKSSSIGLNIKLPKEQMEILTLLQTRKGKRIKIFLLCVSFWSPIIIWFETLAQQGYISQQDLNLFCIVDEIEQILASIKGA